MNLQTEGPSNIVITDLQGDEFWPLSGKPYFDVVLSKSHVKPRYCLVVPVKMNQILPCRVMPVALRYGNREWKMHYNGVSTLKRFYRGWRKFVDDKNLKAGDACVFELMECGETKLTFRVQILRGDIANALREKVGGSADLPILLD